MIKNIAHRGFKSKYPENTLLAFKKAFEIGVDGIEMDVHLSKDGELVIIHDETLDRTTDHKGNIRDYTLKELEQFNASHIYKEKFGFNKIPTLREYFNLVKNKNIISNIEIKNNIYPYDGIEKKVYDLIIEFNLKHKVLISSFNHESMVKMKEIDNEIQCALLTSSWIVNPGKYTKDLGMDGYNPSAYSLTNEKVKEIQSYGIAVNVWLGKSEVAIEKLIEMNVDSIIHDDSNKVKKLLKK